MTYTNLRTIKTQPSISAQGQCLLTGVQELHTQHGTPYKVLILEDYSDQLRAYVWDRTGLLSRVPAQHPVPLHVEITPRVFNHEVIADVGALHPLEQHEMTNAAALLPASLCPPAAQDALHKLVSYLNWLPVEPLRQFLNRVLSDRHIAFDLLTCKGSQKHHHCYRGGLLAHSVDVMFIAGRSAKHGGLTPQEVAITTIAAFLHDIGKIRAVGDAVTRPVHYQLVTHEIQTNRLLEPHLSWLRERSVECATVLDYIFNFLAQPKSTRGHARFIGVDYLLNADQISAARENHKGMADLLKLAPPTRHRLGVEQAGQRSADV